MRFVIELEGEKIRVEIRTIMGRDRVFFDGEEVECDWVALPNDQHSIILEGKVFDLSVRLDRDAGEVQRNQQIIPFRILDPRRLAAASAEPLGSQGIQRIQAQMPGKVVRMLVEAGDTVDYDQGLLVVEAMKMQNEIRAPKGGTVKEIGVAAGQAVNSGDFLLSIE